MEKELKYQYDEAAGDDDDDFFDQYLYLRKILKQINSPTIQS